MQTLLAISKAIELPDAVMYGVADAAWKVFGAGAMAFDSLLRSVVPGAVAYAENYVAGHQHPLTKKLPLMTPTHVAFASVLYILVIFALKPIGKAIGKMQLKNFGTLHNLFLFSLSFYMWAGILVTAAANGFTLWNNPVGTGDGAWRMAKLIWLFSTSRNSRSSSTPSL